MTSFIAVDKFRMLVGTAPRKAFPAASVMMTRVVMPLLAVAMASHATLSAATYYVATNGSDSNSGTLSSPFATVNRGALAAVAGDTVYIRGGSYNQTVSISRSGSSSNPITIAGYPGETAIIDGQYSIPGTWGSLFSVSGDYVIVRDLTIQNSAWLGLVLTGLSDQALKIKAYKNNEGGILLRSNYGLVQDSEVYYNCKHNEFGSGNGWDVGLSAARNSVNHATMRGNKVWNNWGEGLSTYESTYITIEDNIVWDNWATNAYLSDTQYAVFQRNLVYRTPNNPISGHGGSEIGLEMGDEKYTPPSSNNTIINNFFMGSATNFDWWQGTSGGGLVNTLIANNTFVNGYRVSAILIASGAHANSRFENNIVVQSDSLPIAYVPASAGLTFSNNLWSKTPPAAGSGPGDIVADPQLAKTGSTGAGSLSPGWFKLLSTSPAIRRALAMPEVTQDFFKTPRGLTPDVGGHQFVSSSDTTAPSVPTGLSASAVSSSQINLAWTASTDNVGVTGYRVYRNGVQITTTAGTSLQVTGLSPSTAYSFTVAAYDAGGNVSAQSAPASATTLAAADTTAPSIPTSLSGSVVSSSQINLAWTASTDNVGVTGYRVYRNGVQITTTAGTSLQVTGLSASTTYSFTVAAYDAAGNASAQSAGFSATTQASSVSVPLSVTITSPSNGAAIPLGTKILLTAQALDSSPVSSVIFNVDGVVIQNSTTSPTSTGATGTASWQPTSERGWSPGYYVIGVTAADVTGKTATKQITIRLY